MCGLLGGYPSIASDATERANDTILGDIPESRSSVPVLFFAHRQKKKAWCCTKDGGGSGEHGARGDFSRELEDINELRAVERMLVE